MNRNLPKEHAVNFLKYCPHCGSEQFVAQSTKEFACAQCGFHFFTNSAAAVAIIIENERGEIMLTRRARDPWKGMLDLPGGFVDPGESVEQAAHREIREELGIEIDHLQYFASSANKYVFSNYLIETTDICFTCVASLPSGAIVPMDDVCEILWLAPDDINLETIGGESIRYLVGSYIAMKKLRN